ncbi:MAG: glycoside hydrolase family 32 protein [Brachybacterium sp.]|nr:glycoside hydrolase family 32 protein [Brachybacterium sp.]
MTDPHFPDLHRVHRAGWINDPNGIMRIGDRWHVFFQYNPHSARHDRIRWGHVSSPDLVSWREEPMGPQPRDGEADADGCWSGVGLVEDGVPTVVYSGVDGIENHRSRVVVQRSHDGGATWQPSPGVAADIPAEPDLDGIRDPFLFEAAGRKLALQGAGLRRQDGTLVPAVLVFDRSDLDQWRYLGPLLTGDDARAAHLAPADLWECPQLVRIGGRWVLILSRWAAIGGPDGGNALNGVAYLVGDLDADAEVPTFHPTAGGPADLGPDFYAPQAVIDRDRVLLWGWSWEGKARTQDQTDTQAWAGCLTFPRELALTGDTLAARLPRELNTLVGERIEPVDGSAEDVHLEHPARAITRSANGVRVTLQHRDGTESVLAEVTDGPVTVLVDASILEVLPAADAPRTVRVYPEDGERLRITGAEITAHRLRLP